MALPRASEPDLDDPPAVILSVPSGRQLADLRRSVLAWYDTRGRSLAIRDPGVDPWGVLVAEVMAQQTQIGRVAPAWRRFLDGFPGPAALATAAPAEVIRAWRGLGYNRRGLALRQAALAIVAAGGRVPSEPAALEALPGVGPYTARAVAAIAFGRPVGAVDVNVRRVLGRLLAGDGAGPGATGIQAAADLLVDQRRPGDWTHALMDVGAIVCRPARPACEECPLDRWCRTRAARGAAGPVAGVTAGGGPGRAPLGPVVAAAPGHRRRHPAAGAALPRFESTSRWLRGRLVERLRDAPPGAFVAIDGPLGEHSPAAVATALRHLAGDGLVELDSAGRARLPIDPGAPVETLPAGGGH